MNKLKNIIGWLAAFFISIGLAHNLPAQTTSGQTTTTSTTATPTSTSEAPVQLSPFVVSQESDIGYSSQESTLGTRAATNNADYPGSLDVINREMMDDLNALTFKDVIDFGTAGVTQFQNFQDDAMIRGFRTYQTMRNGVVTGFITQDPQPLYDVASVEVIKGPASMVLGNNTYLGGTINYVPFRPTSTPTGFIDYTVTTDIKGESDNRLQLNTMGPLYKNGDFSIDYRLTAGGIYGDLMDKAIDRRDEKFIGGALLINYTKETSLDMNCYYYLCHDYSSYDDFLNYFDAEKNGIAVLSPYSATFSAGLPSNAYERENDTSFDATILSKLTNHSSVKIYESFFYTTSNDFNINTLEYSPDGETVSRYGGPFYEQGYCDNLLVDYTHHYDFKYLTNDFYAGGDYVWTYELQAGYDNSLPSVNITNPNPNYAADGGIIAGWYGNATEYGQNIFIGPDGYDGVYRDYNLSYYLQDNLTFLDGRVILVGGLRWYYDHELNEDADYKFDGAGTYATTIDNQPLQVHKVGIVVKPVSWLSLYWTNLSNSNYQGGLYQPATTGPELPLGNNVATLTEFGAKWNYKPSKQFDIYGMWDYFNETVSNVYTATGAYDTSNGLPVGELLTNTSRGMELEYGMRYTFAGYGMADVFLTGYRADTLAAELPHDVQANGAPNNVWSILGKFTVTNGLFKGIMVGGGAYGQQDYRYEDSLKIPTPTIINLFARYQMTRNWSLQINADNVENKRYVVRIATPALVEGSLPGTLSLSVRYRW